MNKVIGAAAAVAAMALAAPASAQDWTLAQCIRDAAASRDRNIGEICSSLRGPQVQACRTRWSGVYDQDVRRCSDRAAALARRAQPRR